jgi:stress response protein YsnF
MIMDEKQLKILKEVVLTSEVVIQHCTEETVNNREDPQ